MIESKYESILIMLNKIILYGMMIYNFNLDENSLIKTYENYEKQCVSACNFFLSKTTCIFITNCISFLKRDYKFYFLRPIVGNQIDKRF